VTKETPRRFEVLRVFFQIRDRSEMPKLVRRHVNADVPGENGYDLT
jgi:hypothetical protein